MLWNPNRLTLETNAIKFYKFEKEAKHIPVVREELLDELDQKLKILVENTDYQNLWNHFMVLENRYGFSFLNNVKCDEIFENLKAIEESIIFESNDELLKSVCRLSNEAVERYEDEIIQNVYEYSKLNQFENALLFVGAAHKISITRKLQQYNKRGNFKMNWLYYND